MVRQMEMRGVAPPKTKNQLRAEDLAEAEDLLEIKREELEKLKRRMS